jgi:hypothetical protein
MGIVVRKKKKTQKQTSPPRHRHVLRRQPHLLHLSMCSFLITIPQSCRLSNSNSNAQEFHVDIPLNEFNCYDACYNTNMATDICFETL